MSPLLSIRSKRDQMSANERRIADFILGNAHLLRDYSSQQLASALRISQSSVVKFTQKLGFKGYPDLKYSISEALGRHGGPAQTRAILAPVDEPRDDLARDLWERKSHAEEETRLINPARALVAVAASIHRAARVYCAGIGEDSIAAQAFAARLSSLGILTLCHADLQLMQMSLAASSANDVLVIFSEHGGEPVLGHFLRQFRDRQGRVISVTRNTANPLRAHAHFALLISAHDERPHVKPLLFDCARQQLLDIIVVHLSQAGRELYKAPAVAGED